MRGQYVASMYLSASMEELRSESQDRAIVFFEYFPHALTADSVRAACIGCAYEGSASSIALRPTPSMINLNIVLLIVR